MCVAHACEVQLQVPAHTQKLGEGVRVTGAREKCEDCYERWDLNSSPHDHRVRFLLPESQEPNSNCQA